MLTIVTQLIIFILREAIYENISEEPSSVLRSLKLLN